MAEKSGWIVTTEKGRYYARLTVRIHSAFNASYESWDMTEDRAEAHIFETRAKAEDHVRDWPAGWQIERVK